MPARKRSRKPITRSVWKPDFRDKIVEGILWIWSDPDQRGACAYTYRMQAADSME